MNYEKKRRLQNSKQGVSQSERQRIYMKGLFDGQKQVIDRLTESGILPKINFDLKSVYKSDNKHE